MNAPVTAVIVHWRQPESCMDTVDRCLAEPEVANAIVVDNGSPADVLSRLQRFADNDERVHLIAVGSNSGFGPAANRGFEEWLSAREPTEWAALAPHDVIPDAGIFGRMLAAVADRPDVGMISADVGDGMRPRVDHVFGPILEPALSTDELEPVDYAHGTLLLARRQCLVEIGLFDERYFAYDEEADLGLRAKSAGWMTVLHRGARVRNPTVSTPTPLIDYLKERNTILLQRVHFGRRKAAMRFALMLWQLGWGAVRPSSRVEEWSARARVLAIRDVIRRRWGPPPPSLLP